MFDKTLEDEIAHVIPPFPLDNSLALKNTVVGNSKYATPKASNANVDMAMNL